jgi:predicted flap endonuclease-1-like 5' DNA nuclease
LKSLTISKGAFSVASSTQQRRHHTETESGYASLIGAGLLFMMLAFGLAAIFGGTAEASERFNLFLIGGALAFVAFSVVWAFHLRPWRHFDDWSTPAYTGHESHGEAHHDEAYEDAAQSQMIPDAEAEARLAAMHGTVQTVSAGDLEAEAHSHVVPSAEAEAKFASVQSTPAVVTDKLLSMGATAEQDHVDTSKPSSSIGRVTQTTKAATKSAEKDNLQLLEGIGPKIAEALNKAGVMTFAQLASMEPPALEKIVRDAGVRMVGHGETWPQQARLAADGKFDELKALQAQLSSGRR